MYAPSRIARRLGVSATAALSLVLTGTAPALAGDTTPLDTTPPVITSTGLTDGQTVLRQAVLHPVVTDDVAVAIVGVRVGTGSFFHCTADASQGLSCPITVPVALNGTDIDVTVRAFDAAGNRADQITRVHVVAVALSGVLAPKAGTPMRSGPMTATLSDVSTETSKIEMTDGPTGAVLATLTADPWTFTWNASAAATPPCFRLSEPAGNSTTYCSDYVVSDEAPVIKSVWAWHEYGGDDFGGKLAWSSRLDQGTGWIGTDGTITSSATDKAGIDHTELWVDGVLSSSRTGSSTAQSARFDWHDATRGKTFANLQVRVTNRVGLTTTQAFRLNIDNVGPVLQISPRAGTLLRGKQVTVTRTATDQHRIVLPESAGFSSPWQPSPLSYLEYVTLHGDGSTQLRFSVYDELGNPSALNSSVTVDNTKATVGFATAPKNKAKVKGTVKVTATAKDKNGVARVQLLINGKVVATDTTATYKFSINTKKYGKKIKVGLRAYDRAGNVTTTSTRTWYRR